MPRTIETTVYTFDELSDRAKSHACDWFRETSGEDFAAFGADSTIEDAARICGLFGLNINTKPVRLMNGTTRQDPNVYWAVDCRDAGVSYAGSYSYRKGSTSAVAKEAPATWKGGSSDSNAEINRIVRELSAVQRRYFYQIEASISHGRNVYIGSTVDVGHYAGDERVSDDDRETVAELLRDVATWIHRSLEAEWEYRNSDDTIAEDIRANDYTFDEDGNREG